MTNWQTKKLGDAMEFIPTGSHSRNDMMSGLSADKNAVFNIHYGDIHTKYTTYVDLDKDIVPILKENSVRSSMELQDGDLVVADASEDYAGVGSAVELRNVSERKVIGGLHTFALRSKNDEFTSGFTGLILKNPATHKRLMQMSVYSKVYGLTKSSIASVDVSYPEKPEQKRIAGVLEVWDEYIEKLEQKIALKEQLKKGLMQQLLTGKRRLPGFKSPFATLEFKDVFKVLSKYPGYKSSDYSTQGQYPIYDQSYDKYVSGYTDDHSKLIASNQPLTLFGDHSRVVKYIDSESFAVGNDGIKLFKAENDIDDYYAYMLLKSYRIPNTGYNRHFKYIADAVFEVPESTEQRQISNIIKVSDHEIKVLSNKLSEVKCQKKYLLKNLITGTIRTPEDLQPLDSSRLERSAL